MEENDARKIPKMILGRSSDLVVVEATWKDGRRTARSGEDFEKSPERLAIETDGPGSDLVVVRPAGLLELSGGSRRWPADRRRSCQVGFSRRCRSQQQAPDPMAGDSSGRLRFGLGPGLFALIALLMVVENGRREIREVDRRAGRRRLRCYGCRRRESSWFPRSGSFAEGVAGPGVDFPASRLRADSHSLGVRG